MDGADFKAKVFLSGCILCFSGIMAGCAGDPIGLKPDANSSCSQPA